MANTNVTPQGVFGPGILWATRTDIANGTPYNIGFCNEFSTNLAFDTKPLFGQNQFPLLVARSTAKATGKIKAATLSGQALNAVLLGGTWTAGTQYDAFTSPSTAVPVTPFHITPTVPNTGTWSSDLGVVVSAVGTSSFQIGQPFTQVASAPATGQYSVAAGVYTFASADNVSGVSVQISSSYSYTTGATGMSQIIANTLIGTTPTFQLDYKSILYGSTYYLRIYNAIASKWDMNHKLSDWAMPEYDFEFFANAAQNIAMISVASQG